MIQAVLFDIGNVLIGWQPEQLYDRMIGPERRQRLFAEVDLHEMNLRIDAGEKFKETIYAKAEAHPEWGDEIRMWHEHWLEMMGPVIDRSVRMLRALKARGVPVHALSNFGVDSFELALRQSRFDFLHEFDVTFVSGRMRLLKPDPAIYAAVEGKLGLPQDSLFFTDDRADNIAAAAARGWQTHQFTGPDGLADALMSHGLLSQTEAA